MYLNNYLYFPRYDYVNLQVLSYRFYLKYKTFKVYYNIYVKNSY